MTWARGDSSRYLQLRATLWVPKSLVSVTASAAQCGVWTGSFMAPPGLARRTAGAGVGGDRR
jgi:hypothetical protein